MPNEPTVRLAWAGDIHLGHCGADTIAAFCDRVRAGGAAALLLGGDVSTAPDLADDLAALADATGLPVHYVLGNHDHYGGTVAALRTRLAALDDGAAIGEAAAARPDVEFTVLCGHTHGGGTARVRANVTALTQAAEYGRPGFRGLGVGPHGAAVHPDP